jgi:four helix bundle protein
MLGGMTMAKIERFEDIDAWRKARELTKNIYETTGRGGFSKDFGLRDQIRRASVSVMSNIAEGFERGGNKEFRQFLSMAKGSAGEVRSQLYVALDVGYLDEEDFKDLYQLADEAGRLIGGFMRYIEKSGLKGVKFKQD